MSIETKQGMLGAQYAGTRCSKALRREEILARVGGGGEGGGEPSLLADAILIK